MPPAEPKMAATPTVPHTLPPVGDHGDAGRNGMPPPGLLATSGAAPLVDPEPPAPADLVPAPTGWDRLRWYLGSVLLTVLVLVAGLRLDKVDLHTPLAYDWDALLIMPMVKATLERGFGGHWRNERLGYPGIQELHDFPVIDHLHFAIIWLLGKALSDWMVVYNVYYLLTWPLTTLTAMAVFRQLRLTLPASALGGLLYSFAPYHYLRGEAHYHYFLAAYWVVPLSLLPAIAICRGDFAFFHRGPGGRNRLAIWRLGTVWQVLLAATTASAGAYYAFFACAIYAFVGLYGIVTYRTWKAAASACLLCGLVLGFGIVNHIPAFVYEAANGKNSVAERWPEESELYGMKIAQLVLPIDGHNVTMFSHVKCRYNAGRQYTNENSCSTLGMICSVGLLWLLAGLLFPLRRGWPQTPLGAVATFLVLYATIGGFSSVFSLLVFDQIRCPNRISIDLAFICLFAVLWPIDRFLVTRTGWARRLRYPAMVAILGLGLADQTPSAWFGEVMVKEIRKEPTERFEADRRFFGRIDELMPAGSKVFMLPYMPYPEAPVSHNLNWYEHARGYLFTNGLVLSYGSIKNREADMWYEEVAHRQPDELLRRVVVRGFDGLFVDKRGYVMVNHQNQGDVFLAQIERLTRESRVKVPTLTHEDGLQVFVDLRPYRDWLYAKDPKYFQAESQREQEWGTITWLKGFASGQPYGHRNGLRWVSLTAQAVIVNPGPNIRTFLLEGTFGVDSSAGEFRIQIDGGSLQVQVDGELVPWFDEFTVEKPPIDTAANPIPRSHGVRKSYRIEVPPGRHRVWFRCTPPRFYMPTESRPRPYYIEDIRVTN